MFEVISPSHPRNSPPELLRLRSDSPAHVIYQQPDFENRQAPACPLSFTLLCYNRVISRLILTPLSLVRSGGEPSEHTSQTWILVCPAALGLIGRSQLVVHMLVSYGSKLLSSGQLSSAKTKSNFQTLGRTHKVQLTVTGL